jgi:hypothetical protein
LPFGRVIAVWMLIMLVETAHGALRGIFVAPIVGDMHARQLGVVVGSLLIFAIACGTIRWMRLASSRAQLQAGAIWVASTLAFEVLLGLSVGASWERILSDYNPLHGGFMVLGLAFMFFAPRLAAKLRRI